MVELRRLVGSGSTFDQFRKADDSVVDDVARLLASGRLRLCPHDRYASWSSGSQGPEASSQGGSEADSSAAVAPPPAAAPTRTVDLSKEKKTTWLAIELVDMEGKPVPGRPYEVRRSGKVLKSGKLDGKGFARLDGIEPDGNYEVSFLDLDKEAWQPAPDEESGKS